MGCNNKQCPKGQYLLESTCECTDCPDGQFTDVENGLHRCLTCQECNSMNTKEKSSCKKDQNTVCVCQERFYCTERDPGPVCAHCALRNQCEAGQGAVNVGTPGNTICKPCQPGHFNNVTSYNSRCLPHTNCTALGREVKTPGTLIADAECGNHMCTYPAHLWMLPAGLWLGLIISAIIAIIAAYAYWKVKRQSKHPVSAADEMIVRFSPATPDILPPPNELYKNECTETQPLNHCAVETSSISCDCTVECDGPGSPTMTSPTSPMRLTPLAPPGGVAGDSIVSTVCQSEPQEDEWPGA
ncbi:tumor necrosis factor receptor superfamily member 1B [Sardina pilchardus]|uniref:tumor necrosis factor receptor superfamily member 1B n=1 Tax=Sardina pilchardus TaxID=27697 RepID=UPI002E1009D2